MTQDPKARLTEISTHDLTHVTGGFLPLLGLLGSVGGIAGQIMGGIGKKKAQQAEEIMSQAQAGSGQAQPGAGDASASPTSGTNLMPQQQPTS